MKKIALFSLLVLIILVFCSCGKSGKIELGTGEKELSSSEQGSVASEIAQSISEIIEKTTEALESSSEPDSGTTTTRPATTTSPTTTRPASTSIVTTKAETTEPTTVSTTASTTRAGDRFSFTTTDMNGNSVSLSDYSNAKVIMINMWEPWCGPCVNEMSDLNSLYRKYKDDGFVILGVTSSGTLSDAKSVVRQLGISYPVLVSNYQFNKFDTGYVPTTVFIDGDGYILTSSPIVGSKSYAQWESIIKGYLNK